MAASTPINASVGEGLQERWAGGASSPGSVTTEGGNVTEVNITGTNVSTEKWAGFYGNISGGSIILADTIGNQFYRWDTTISNLWKVYATRDQTPTWANLDAGDFTGLPSWLTSSDADNIYRTLTSQAASATFADIVVTNVNYTLTFDGTGVGNTEFPTYYLDQSTGVFTDTIWATNATDSETGFNDLVWQYQLMVPVNRTAATYYFFLEVN
ncbi:MAG: hypothetical protein QXG02_03925 [Candidatus Anstonellales archaeon]